MNPDIKMRAVLTCESGIARWFRVASSISVETTRTTREFKKILVRTGFITSDHGCGQGAGRIESDATSIGCEHVRKTCNAAPAVRRGYETSSIDGQSSQLIAVRQIDLANMANHGEDMNAERKTAKSKADFIRWAGIESELAEFLAEFIKKPEILFSMPCERRRQIENQMDAILSSFEQ